MSFPTAADNLEKLDLEHLAPKAFDEHDADCMVEVCGKHLAGPIQSLLFAAMQVQYAKEIEGLNKDKAIEALLREAENIRKACHDEYRDLL